MAIHEILRRKRLRMTRGVTIFLGVALFNHLASQFAGQMESFRYGILFINIILNLLFAGAVARDAGALHKLNQRPALVSAATWAFATLLGGVVTAAIYWFIHHSTLTRPSGN